MVQALHQLPDGLVALVGWPPIVSEPFQADRAMRMPAGTYHGAVLQTGSGGASTVAVYDGQDTTGDLIDYFGSAASGHEAHFYERGIILKRGVYVDLGSNVTAFTLYYRPAPRELA